jgi:hypothetical protein
MDWPQLSHVHVCGHVLVLLMVVAVPHGFSGGIQFAQARRRLLRTAMVVLLGKKQKRHKTKSRQNKVFLHRQILPLLHQYRANPKQM